MAKKTTAIALLLTTEEISEDFNQFSQHIEKFEAISNSVNIVDDESLAICENNAMTLKDYINRIEATREAVGAKYYQTHKAIGQYAKNINDQFKKQHGRITSEITNYRSLQEAHKKAELEAKEAEMKELEKEQIEEKDKLLTKRES